MGGLVGDLPAGSRIDMVVSRAGRDQKIALTVAPREGADVEELPGPARPVEEEFPEERPLGQRPASLGVRALPVSADLQRRYGLVVRRGAVIENIQPGSPADRYGLPIGAAIVAVDGARVDTPDDLAAAIGAARPGDSVEISFYQRDQVFRKQVRLGPAGAAPPVVGEDRPLLRRLERVIEGEPGGNGQMIAELQAQINALQRQVEALESRLERLEGRGRAEDDAANELPLPEKSPELKPPLKPLVP
jgi:membrane-associated protease RseP (regulator of RpoE activity)